MAAKKTMTARARASMSKHEDGQDEEPQVIEEAADDPNDSDDDARLAAKYESLTRQIFPQKVELPVSTLRTMVSEQIDLAPTFQRRDVWDVQKQSKFIESLIMNVPVPPVFMGEDNYGKYVVLDGRQRLTAIVKFMNNEYALKSLKVWKELNGDRYADLQEKKLDVSLTRRFLPAVVLLKESSSEVKYDVFERLNTGGLNLNSMEIRNAVYRGKFTNLLHACSEHKLFRQLWHMPTVARQLHKDATYKRMRDLELVLRFFALSAAQDSAPNKRSAFKTYLGSYMAERNEEYRKRPQLEEEDRSRFERAIQNCYGMLGKEAFVGPKGSLSAPLGDALMYGLMELTPTQRKDSGLAEAVKKVRDGLLRDKTFLETMDQGTNGRAKIEKRLGMARKAVEKAVIATA